MVRIDHDAVVRATMDSSRADHGVDAARAAYGLTGAGVTVCILDTGVNPAHERLDSKAIVWEDFVGSAATPFDDHGHGTHVASIAVGDGVGGPDAGRYGGGAGRRAVGGQGPERPGIRLREGSSPASSGARRAPTWTSSR